MTFNKKWQSLQTFPSLKKLFKIYFLFFLHNVDSLECCCKKLFFAGESLRRKQKKIRSWLKTTKERNLRIKKKKKVKREIVVYSSRLVFKMLFDDDT